MRGIILLIIIITIITVLLLLIFFLDVGFHIVWFPKYPYLPHRRDFFSSKTPTHLWKFQLSWYILLLIFMHLINHLVSENPSLRMQMYFLFPAVCIRRLREPTTSQEIPIPSVGDYGYFWNCTCRTMKKTWKNNFKYPPWLVSWDLWVQ